MIYTDIVIALAVLQFIAFGFKVGGARVQYGVKAPATTGHELFERHFRVQQNTLEQLLVFLPGMYLFSRYFHPEWAAAIGLVYLIGRQVYAMSYAKDPAKRGFGFAMTFFPNVALLVGGLAGAIWHLIRA
jgi:glutathione S-transferase